MTNFNTSLLIDLDKCVINALEFFADANTKFPAFNVNKYTRPLVVGSGNAAATGKILFEGKDAVFADESTFEAKLQSIKNIDGIFLISASGGKHAPAIAETAKKYNLEVELLTCNPNSAAADKVGNTLVFPSLPEPYTYNTSTYMAMILAATAENPAQTAGDILEHIKNSTDPYLQAANTDFAGFDAFFVLVPEAFDLIRIMMQTKFVELFGRKIARDVFTFEQAKHATTVVQAEKELFLSFGDRESLWGKDKLTVALPKNTGYAGIMAVGYYVIGKIQAQKPQWFKESIPDYAEKASEMFGQTITPIVNFKQ